jgi:hypothetical protein
LSNKLWNNFIIGRGALGWAYFSGGITLALEFLLNITEEERYIPKPILCYNPLVARAYGKTLFPSMSGNSAL